MMLHLSYNLKIIRGISGLNQADFGALFKVTLAMQKSYEAGKAKPDALYLQRVSSFTGVPEELLKNKRLKESDIGIKAEFEEKGEYEHDGVKEESSSYKSDQSDQKILLEILINQKATLQYLREMQERLVRIEGRKTGTEAVKEMKELLKKGKVSAEKDKQSNQDGA